jgi:phthalate 4,5-dioxygenase oxygenase subunit
MLTLAENELLTRVGPDAGMGKLFRRYWIPALLADELTEPDGAPVRVRLLGEDLIAFRDTNGRVGLLEESCPHRGTSLALGLNAECGVRCLYHGYKFDVEGRCVDTPTEPDGSNFASKIRARAYPARIAGGFVWAYLGPADLEPEFPNFEWFGLPEAHYGAYKVFAECNYAQTVEGAIDSAHAGVLHRTGPWGSEGAAAHEEDLNPKLEVQYTKFGMRYGATRELADGTLHSRITAVLLPCWTFIPPSTGNKVIGTRRLVNAFVPRDDTTTWHFQVFFDPEKPFDRAHRAVEGGLQLDDQFRKLRNMGNWYQQDRELMKSGAFSGITGILVQDHAVGETQGKIADRTREHLGTSDLALIAWRRMMLRAAKQVDDDQTPPGIGVPYEAIRSETVTTRNSESWRDLAPLAAAYAP